MSFSTVGVSRLSSNASGQGDAREHPVWTFPCSANVGSARFGDFAEHALTLTIDEWTYDLDQAGAVWWPLVRIG
ncbi:hypothetical protein [Micromonospora saelicesensis]|uniref:hypothetical protein n=1 Tax=Micromonospora saelicesensis TaxID=285676 RepID=UPI0011BF6C98|nr:hypothetical protein [Micromonospora saelicesensis]